MASKTARDMVMKFGFSEKLGLINYEAGDSDEVFLGRELGHEKPYGAQVAASIDEEVKAHVGIALDELLNNQISYEKREDLVIDIDFSFEKDDLKVVITSNGADYNPFVKHVHKHLSKDDDDTTPGGFGVTLVKTLSKSYSYEYKNKKSVISLVF